MHIRLFRNRSRLVALNNLQNKIQVSDNFFLSILAEVQQIRKHCSLSKQSQTKIAI